VRESSTTTPYFFVEATSAPAPINVIDEVLCVMNGIRGSPPHLTLQPASDGQTSGDYLRVHSPDSRRFRGAHDGDVVSRAFRMISDIRHAMSFIEESTHARCSRAGELSASRSCVVRDAKAKACDNECWRSSVAADSGAGNHCCLEVTEIGEPEPEFHVTTRWSCLVGN